MTDFIHNGATFTRHPDGSITVPAGYVGPLPAINPAAYTNDATLLQPLGEPFGDRIGMLAEGDPNNQNDPDEDDDVNDDDSGLAPELPEESSQ